MFRWSCLTIATVAMLGFYWLVNDLRLELKRSAQTVNEKLPQILEKTEKTAETLAAVSDDIKQVRDLAGVANAPRDKTLVAFADSVLDLIDGSGGSIGLEKKVFGKGLKEVVPAPEWVVGARKEAIWLSLRARSKSELLTGLCQNKYGSDWYIQIADQAPTPLLEWLKANHAETRALAASNPKQPTKDRSLKE